MNAVVEALTSQAPRDRYPVGLDGRLIITMASWLPTSAMDYIVDAWIKTPTPKIVQKG